jgi:ABC-type amino acid transport substrate-binding protein
VYTPFIDKYFKDIGYQGYNNANSLLDLQAERIDAVIDDITFTQCEIRAICHCMSRLMSG